MSQRGGAPRIDLHSHAGRCFFCGMPDGTSFGVSAGELAAALEAAATGGLTALVLATVSDLPVLGFDDAGGLVPTRGFEPGEAYQDHRRQLDALVDHIGAAGHPLLRTAADLDRVVGGDGFGVLLGCEGADFLDPELTALEEASRLGVSLLTLVHYRPNEVGDLQTADPVHGGLSRFGRDVVTRCNELGIVVDCAHADLRTTLDVVETSSRPVTISHSHLGDAHPRLLSTQHARAVTEAGGVIGAWPSGVTSETLDDFVDEIARLIDVVGDEHVAIGTDLDGNYKPVLTRHDEFETVAERLAGRGFDASTVDRVLGGNVVELYRAVTAG